MIYGIYSRPSWQGFERTVWQQLLIGREVEDLDAILKKTSVEYIFGASSGGLIALESAIKLKQIKKIGL